MFTTSVPLVATFANQAIAFASREAQKLWLAMLLSSWLIFAGAHSPSAVAQDLPPLTPFAPPPPVLDIQVTDKQGRPIREFLIIAGTPAGSMTSAEFQERTGREATNWQQHTARLGRDGKLIWPLRRSYSRMKLRFEAAGYRPRSSHWITKDDGGQKFTIELVADSGSEHRLLRPDGAPASGAAIAVALPQKNAVIEDGKLRGSDLPLPQTLGDRWSRPEIIKTDESGRFRLPPESDPAAVVLVVHEAGVLEMPWKLLRSEVEWRLRPWGRIEGQVQWRDRAGAGEPIHLLISRDTYGYPCEIEQRAKTTSDAQGRFVFDRVLPGRIHLARPIKPKKNPESTVFFGELSAFGEAKAGEPTQVLIGGRGRTVKGQLAGRDSWDNASVSFNLHAPHFGLDGDDVMWDAYGVFQQSEIGPLFFRQSIEPNADGSFEFPHVLPGSYELRVRVPGVENYAICHQFTVESETADEAPLALDLGAIKVPQPGGK